MLGFDGYNWSNQEPRHGDGSWRTFSQLATQPYQRVTALDSTKPVWLCEWGTTEAQGSDPGGVSKAQWFSQAGSVTDFSRLTALIYFSEHD